MDHRPVLSDFWCEVDDCPNVICNGPHRAVRTTLGVELLRPDQEPVGRPLEDDEEDSR